MHVCRSTVNPCGRSIGRPSTPAVDRSVDRLHGPHFLFVLVDHPGQPAVQIFLFKMSCGRPGGRPEPTAIICMTCRSTDRCPGWLNGSILDLFCFLYVPTSIFCFQVVKLTPYDLVSLMNGIYPLPINRGHVFWFFHKKNIQVSSVFKRRSVSLLSISNIFFFKSFSVGF